MFKLTLRNLAANKMRLALTTFAVVLGVSFVVSSLVLGDGLRDSFGSLSEEIVGGTDLEIEPYSEFGSPPPLEASLLATVQGVDGVKNAEGQVGSDGIQPIRADGTVVSTVGPPLIGFSWIEDPALNQMTVVEGRAPQEGYEFTIDSDAATDNGFQIGQTYSIIMPPGRIEMELVGITRFGEANDTLGAVLTQYPLATVQELFDREGQLDEIVVSFEDDADAATVEAAVNAVIGDDAVAQNQAAITDDVKQDFNSGINIFNNILLGFAGVALFVSIFIISNTFNIVLGQRTKELALLRAIGASPSQVRRSTMSEAAVVGLVASILGIAGGLALNYGLRALFDALGAGLPESDLIVAPRTIIVAFIVGVGVTLLSAFSPARKASSVAPIAAMHDSADAPRGSDRRRNFAGALVMAAGIALGAFGLFGDIDGTAPRVLALGAGAAVSFIGLSLASPAVAQPIINVFGYPLRALGIAGSLSTQNAGRNPRRTSSTAASLMVGLTLVTAAMVLGESIKQSITETLASEVKADFIANPADTSINAGLLNDLEASGSFSAISGYRYDEIKVGDEVFDVMGGDLVATGMLFDIGVSDGELSADPNAIAVERTEANRVGLAAGDRIDVSFPSGVTESMTVTAIFDKTTIVDDKYVINVAGWDDRFGESIDWWAAALVADGVADQDARATLASLEETYPQVGFESQAEYRESAAAQIDGMLVAVNAMLVLAILIALLGIANTLALSVFERTREIGLLRAVGMSRSQTRRMVRWEAAQVAVFGSVLGIGLGLVFGWGVVTALPDNFVSTLALPVSRIGVLALVCAVSGLAAAALPARRAAKMDVLDAISHA